jgi:UDP-glucuronate decarboxylase
MNILVAGGSGFIGYHLCYKLLLEGHNVISMDNHSTGRNEICHPNYLFIPYDITNEIDDNVINSGYIKYSHIDQVYNLASPAAPDWYRQSPIDTFKTNINGTINLLNYIRKHNIPFLQVSTIKVMENADHLSKDACYVEGKRGAEFLCYTHKRAGYNIKIARLYSVFGTRMSPKDPRVIPVFINKALNNENIDIFDGGTQLDSFTYISDIIDGLIAAMNYNGEEYLFTFGNPNMITIRNLAEKIKELSGSTSVISGNKIGHSNVRTTPDLYLANKLLFWSPKVTLEEGLEKTINYFKNPELRYN